MNLNVALKNVKVTALISASSSSSSVSRQFSAVAPHTPEQIKQYAIKAEKHKQFVRQNAEPKIFTEGAGTGKELSLPKNISEISALSGMPAQHAGRTVVIAQKMRKTQQQGQRFAHLWDITWKNQERWSNPLMGWTSGADPMSSVKLTFNTSEDAVFFAQKNGWKYEVKAPSAPRVVTPGTYTYADNFLPRKVVQHLKQGQGDRIFANSGYGKSHWFMPLKYHGDGEVVQFGPPPPPASSSSTSVKK